ncbi:hypothetical protein BT69DRAFT_1327757, partial [Atractiella rhizophila]
MDSWFGLILELFESIAKKISLSHNVCTHSGLPIMPELQVALDFSTKYRRQPIQPISALRRQQALENQRDDGDETPEEQHAELMLDVMASSLGSSKNTPTDVHHDLSTLSTLSPSPLHQAITEDNEDQESDDELHLHLDGQYYFADVQVGSYMAGESEEEDVENSAGLEGSDIEDGGEGVANPESGSEGHDQGGIDPDEWIAQSFRRR